MLGFNVSSLPLMFFGVGDFGIFCYPNFHFIVWFQMRGDLLLLSCFFENGFVLEFSLPNTSFVVFDFSLQM